MKFKCPRCGPLPFDNLCHMCPLRKHVARYHLPTIHQLTFRKWLSARHGKDFVFTDVLEQWNAMPKL